MHMCVCVCTSSSTWVYNCTVTGSRDDFMIPSEGIMRFLLHLCVQSTVNVDRKKTVPCYIHIQESNSDWYNENKKQILLDFSSIITDNIMFIESRTKSSTVAAATSENATYMSPIIRINALHDGCIISLSLQTKSIKFPNYSLLLLPCTNASTAESMVLSSFEVYAWLFPINAVIPTDMAWELAVIGSSSYCYDW